MKDEIGIRPFEFSDADYATWKAVHDAAYPDEPLSLEQLRYEHSTRNAERLFRPFVVEQGDGAVAVGAYGESNWSYKPGKYFLSMKLRPNYPPLPILQAIYDHVLADLTPRTPAPTEIGVVFREDKHAEIAFWLADGFFETDRELISELTVSEFDDAAFAWAEPRLQELGLTVRTVAELQESEPDAWQQKLYGLVWLEGMVDVPGSGTWTPPGLEQFIKEDIETPHFRAEAYFVAVDADGNYASLTSFRVDPSDPLHLHTDMTATARDYRRKGVAMAVKVHAIRWAQAYGAETLVTENHAENPMYALNVKLGFRPKPAWVRYQKDL